MHSGVGLLTVLLAVWHVHVSETLECFSCTNIPNISDCLSAVKCSLDEECFTEARGLGNNTDFTLGCRTSAQCIRTSTAGPVSIVGRKLDDRSSQSSIGCQQCCGTDYCNKKICNNPTQIITNTDGQCHDDPDYNCELISGTFNICGDVAHAKTVCRKWCGLLHSGWSGWSAWGSCSVSCGVGLQHRERSCSRPYPGPDENPCFGGARDDRVCLAGACTDGGWSAWTTWSVCSASCNGGLVSRSRSCDNPSPSILGEQCVGQDDEYHTCNTHACPAPVVVFSVNNPRSTLSNGGTDSGVIIYRTIVTNVGSGYNVTSGEFTCGVPGIYSFDISILHSGTAGASSCYIQHNGHNIAVANAHEPSAVAGRFHGASASVYLTLVVGDGVHVYCHGFQYLFRGIVATFNGALVSPT